MLSGGKPTKAFERFYRSYLSTDSKDQYYTWHEGVDAEALKRLSGQERDEAERLLLEAVAKNGDGRAVVGLGLLRSQKAVEPLKKLLQEKGRVDAAQALWRIEGFPGAEDYILTTLRDTTTNKSTRIDTCSTLWEFKTPKTSQALQEAVKNDPEYLVRYNAARALLVIHGYAWQTADKHLSRLAQQLSRAPADAARELDALIANKPLKS